MKQISSAFVKAKRSFGTVLKEKTNPHFKSKYADLAACIEAVDNACLENGIAFYQETFVDETGVTIETVFLHESGETLRCGKLHVPAAKQDPQGYGSALSYARRYSLLTAGGLAAEDDDGNAASKPRKEERTGVAADVLAMSPIKKEDEAYLLELASDVLGIYTTKGVELAVLRLDSEDLEPEQKIFVAQQWDSKTRNTIKAESIRQHSQLKATA